MSIFTTPTQIFNQVNFCPAQSRGPTEKIKTNGGLLLTKTVDAVTQLGHKRECMEPPIKKIHIVTCQGSGVSNENNPPTGPSTDVHPKT